jgi:molecular chaperone DnaK
MSVIGIDLGTTNSCLAVIKGRGAEVIVSAEGGRVTPSAVYYPEEGPALVGAGARRFVEIYPDRVAIATKRLIGRRADDPTLSRLKLGYEIVADKDGWAALKLADRIVTPVEIAAAVISTLKQAAEDALGRPVEGVVVTVPAYFNADQRAATKRAAEAAGAKLLALLAEPTAAAMAYGLDRREKRRVAVYDLGGGTFDFSILEIGDDVLEVKAVAGDSALGGEDFDQALAQHFFSIYRDSYGVDLTDVSMHRGRFLFEAQRAKHELSGIESYGACILFVDKDPDSGTERHFKGTVTRKDLERLTEPLIQRTLEPCRQALADAGLTPLDIDEVVLVGGMTRMPRVQAVVEQFFGRKPSKKVNPDEAIAVGAALHAAVRAGRRASPQLFDVNPIGLGIVREDGTVEMLIDRNTPLPVRRVGMFTTAHDNQPCVTVQVCQGENEVALNNTPIGRFDLDELPPEPAGTPNIAVSIDMDTDGVLELTAKDLRTGKETPVQRYRAS